MTRSRRSRRTRSLLYGMLAVLIAVIIGIFLTTVGSGPVDGKQTAKGRKRQADATPIQVVTSLGLFADMVARVGGEAVTVTALIAADADPHSWEPSIAHMKAVADADIFIFNGLGLEPWVERLLVGAAQPATLVLRLADGRLSDKWSRPVDSDIETRPGNPPAKSFGRDQIIDNIDEATVDPHLWLDIRHGIRYVRHIEAVFRSLRPDLADLFASRTDAYVDELTALDEWFQRQVNEIPKQRRLLVTDHDAYTHMAARYGLTRIGFIVSNPDREPSAREVATLVQKIRQTQVPAVFAEPHIGPSFIDELAREAKVPVGVLYTDGFTAEIKTYVDMMRANGEALRKFLGK